MVGRLVSSPRGATYYWIERNADAQAPWIIFTHGLCANHQLFDKQLPFFRLNYHVLLWDLPIHGRSRPYHAFTYAHAAEELKQITDREHIKQAILVGHGIGGYVCQEFASRWPEMVQAFVGVSAMPFGVALYPESDQKELKKVPQTVKRLPERLLQTGLARKRTQTLYGYQNALHMFEQMSKKEMVQAFAAAYGDRFTHKAVVQFRCPVMLAIGAMDYTGKIAEYCRIWSEKQGYPMTVIPDASHNANTDNADVFNDTVSKFLRRSLRKNKA